MTEKLAHLRTAYHAGKVALTLFQKINHPFRAAYLSNRSPEIVPVNTEENVLGDMIEEIRKRKIIYNSSPYWLPGKLYDPFEVFSTSIQFLNSHNEPIPLTVLPPENDIKLYISRVLNSEKRLHILDQFRILLDISGNNIVGAANIGLIASRFLARGQDTRAYPHINISAEDMSKWNRNIAQFEVYENDDQCDGPGDTYYFWTHLFTSLLYPISSGIAPRVLDSFFIRGTDVMVQLRKAVGYPTVSKHSEPSLIGRNVGLAVAHIFQVL